MAPRLFVLAGEPGDYFCDVITHGKWSAALDVPGETREQAIAFVKALANAEDTIDTREAT